jgi:hypothetical protein
LARRRSELERWRVLGGNKRIKRVSTHIYFLPSIFPHKYLFNIYHASESYPEEICQYGKSEE